MSITTVITSLVSSVDTDFKISQYRQNYSVHVRTQVKPNQHFPAKFILTSCRFACDS